MEEDRSCRADLRQVRLVVVDGEAADAGGDAVFFQAAAVPVAQVLVGGTQRAQDAAGHRGLGLVEEIADGVLHLADELFAAGQRRLDYDVEVRHVVGIAQLIAVDADPGRVFLRLAVDDAELSYPDHEAIMQSEIGR